jgi:hypothetical protein
MKSMVYDKSRKQEKERYTEALNKYLKADSNAEVVVDDYKQVVIEFENNNDYIYVDELLDKLENISDSKDEVYIIPHDDNNENFTSKNVNHVHIYIKTDIHRNTLYSIVNNTKKVNKETFESQLKNLNKIDIKITNLKQKIQEQRKNMAQVILHTKSDFSVSPTDLQIIQQAKNGEIIKPFGIEVPLGSKLSGGDKLETIKQTQQTKKLPLYYEFYVKNVNNNLTNKDRENLINRLKNRFDNDIDIKVNNSNDIVFKIRNFKLNDNKELIINKKETLFLELLKELERNNILTLNMENKTEAIFKSINDDLISKMNSNNPELQQEYNNYINSIIQTYSNNPIIKTSLDIENRFLKIYEADLKKYKEKIQNVKSQSERELYQNLINQIQDVLQQKIDIQEQQKIDIENITDDELKKEFDEIEQEIENIKNNKYINDELKKQVLKELETKKTETYNNYMNKVKEKLETELKEREQQLKELTNEIKEQTKQNKELTEKSKELQTTINDLKLKQIELNKLLDNKTIKINELDNKVKELQIMISEYNNKVLELNNELQEVYKKNDELQNELNKEKEVNNYLQQQNEKLENEIGNLQNEIENKNQQVKEFNEQIKQKDKTIYAITEIDTKIDNILKDKNIDVNKKIKLLEQLKKDNNDTIISNSINNTIILVKQLKNEKIELNNKHKEINKVKENLNNKDNELQQKDKKLEKLEEQIKEFKDLLNDSAKVIKSLIKITEEQKLDEKQKEVINNIKKTFTKNFKPN